MRAIKHGLRNALRNPLRFALVVLLLGTSMMFVAAMIVLNASAQKRLSDARTQIGTGIDITQVGSGGPLSNSTISNQDAQKVASVKGVASVSESIIRQYDEMKIKGTLDVPDGMVITGVGNGSKNNGTLPPLIQGITNTSASFQLMGGVVPKMVEGRYFNAADQNANVAMTSTRLAQRNGWKLGSQIELKGVKLTIVGLFKTEQQSIGDNNIVLPLQTMQRLYKLDGVSALTAYAASDTEVDTVAQRLRQALGTKFDVTPKSQMVADTLNALTSAQSTIQTTLLVAFLTTALIIVFAVFIIVRERTQEIGLLKAIGASHGQVISQFAIEVLTFSVSAAGAALLLLAVAGPTLAKRFDINPSSGVQNLPNGGRVISIGSTLINDVASRSLTVGLNVQTLLLIFGLSIVLAVLASMVPAWYVARVRPAQVLRQAVD